MKKQQAGPVREVLPGEPERNHKRVACWDYPNRRRKAFRITTHGTGADNTALATPSIT